MDNIVFLAVAGLVIGVILSLGLMAWSADSQAEEEAAGLSHPRSRSRLWGIGIVQIVIGVGICLRASFLDVAPSGIVNIDAVGWRGMVFTCGVASVVIGAASCLAARIIDAVVRGRS